MLACLASGPGLPLRISPVSAEDAPCRQLLTEEDAHGDSGHKMIQGPRAQSHNLLATWVAFDRLFHHVWRPGGKTGPLSLQSFPPLLLSFSGFPVFSQPPSGLSLALIPTHTELFARKLGVG